MQSRKHNEYTCKLTYGVTIDPGNSIIITQSGEKIFEKYNFRYGNIKEFVGVYPYFYLNLDDYHFLTIDCLKQDYEDLTGPKISHINSKLLSCCWSIQNISYVCFHNGKMFCTLTITDQDSWKIKVFDAVYSFTTKCFEVI